MSKNPHIFITIANQHIQEMNGQFYETLNNVGPMVFASNQEQNESYTFKDMILQPYKPYFILAIIKEVEAHEARNHWTLMKIVDYTIIKNKDGKLKTILYIWYFKHKIFPSGRLIKQKSILCAHRLIQQWGDNYWKTYAPVVNWVSLRSLLAIVRINEVPSS